MTGYAIIKSDTVEDLASQVDAFLAANPSWTVFGQINTAVTSVQIDKGVQINTVTYMQSVINSTY